MLILPDTDDLPNSFLTPIIQEGCGRKGFSDPSGAEERGFNVSVTTIVSVVIDGNTVEDEKLY